MHTAAQYNRTPTDSLTRNVNNSVHWRRRSSLCWPCEALWSLQMWFQYMNACRLKWDFFWKLLCLQPGWTACVTSCNESSGRTDTSSDRLNGFRSDWLIRAVELRRLTASPISSVLFSYQPNVCRSQRWRRLTATTTTCFACWGDVWREESTLFLAHDVYVFLCTSPGIDSWQWTNVNKRVTLLTPKLIDRYLNS